jgi:hypothetical protein
LSMSIGVFFCNQIPRLDLIEVNWLIQNPIRDQELEEELGEEVWMVEYNADHPDMQYHNRYYTCIRYGFLEATFEDEALLDDRCAIFPELATNSLTPSINPVPITASVPLPAPAHVI